MRSSSHCCSFLWPCCNVAALSPWHVLAAGLSAMVPTLGHVCDTAVSLPGSSQAFRKVVGSAMYM